ncbi:hypothetical protein SLA2020_155090 [Shorea laevis]
MLTNHLAEAATYLKKDFRLQPKRQKLVGWEPPPPRTCKINVDGSSLGSQGLSVAGGICRDSLGLWQFGFNMQVGVGHAVRAEIFAILKGLEIAWQKNYRKVILESDCLLAVHKVMHGTTNLDPYGAWISRCRELLQRDWQCEIRHVFREANNCADVMASKFYHLGKGWHYFAVPPVVVTQKIMEDLLGVCRPRASRLLSA